MRPNVKKILLLILLVLMPCRVPAQPPDKLNLRGFTDILTQNKGKVIAINFFATWCPPCRVEIPDFSRAAEEYAGKEIVFIGLSVDEDPGKVEEFVKKMEIRYPIYIAERDITGAYRVNSIPHNAFYSSKGQLMISEPGILDSATIKLVVDKLLNN
jgi:thiol-disulfide isomerase/thioredoxin